MTVKELSQLRYLNHEIEQDKRHLAELNMLSANSTMTVTGLPHISNIAQKAVLINEIRDVIEIKKQLCIKEYNRLMQYIAAVDDSLMRQILTFRYIHGFSWVQVAMRIGGGNTEDSVRIAHKRFLKKQ